MCIIGIAHLAARRYPLIVAANRDERHQRPTSPATWWPERPDILSGRDLLAGGTWLGLSTSGRFAAVTNVFDGQTPPAELSRGALVGNFLVSSTAADAYARALVADRGRYGPYNLLLLDRTGLRFASNRWDDAALAPGIHASSNNRPGTDWPKVGVLAEALRTAVDGADDGEPSASGAASERLAAGLLDMLSGKASRGTRETAPDSLFIVGREFGTRCSTVLVVGADGRALFVERSFDAAGNETGNRRFAFDARAFAGRASGEHT